MMKKNFVLSDEAIRLLNMPELKLRLMVFFGVNDVRTIETYLKNNLPDGPLMNYNICGLVIEYAPYMSVSDVYRKLSSKERDEMNKTKQEIKKNYLKKQAENENREND